MKTSYYDKYCYLNPVSMVLTYTVDYSLAHTMQHVSTVMTYIPWIMQEGAFLHTSFS